jgi:hypothetical protein
MSTTRGSFGGRRAPPDALYYVRYRTEAQPPPPVKVSPHPSATEGDVQMPSLDSEYDSTLAQRHSALTDFQWSMPWVNRPSADGWYWHRFFVHAKPIYNMCCVLDVKGVLFIHYLGDEEHIPFSENTGDAYWGPLEPPERNIEMA